MVNLRWLNIGAAILHLVLAVSLLMWYLSTYIEPSNLIDTSLYVFDVHRINGVEDTCSHPVYNGPLKMCVDVKQITSSSSNLLIILMVVIIGFTSVMHFVYAIFGNFYDIMIQNGNNWLRWVEYSISASLLLVVIAFTIGIKDFDVIILFIFVSVGIMCLGNSIERSMAQTNPKSNWSATFSGWFMLVALFTVLVRSYLVTQSNFPEIPAFVTAVLVLTLILYASFGVVPLVQQYFKVKKYAYIEATYIFLSLISKFTLTLLITSGIVARSTSRTTGTD